MTTPQLPMVSNSGNVIVDDALTTIVQSQVDQLMTQGINKIILISHLKNMEEEKMLAQTLKNVDVMIAGGGEDLLTNDANNALSGMSVDGDYPYETIDAEGKKIYVVTTPGKYQYLGNLILTFDDAGKVIKIGEESDVVLIKDFGANPYLVNAVENPIRDYILNNSMSTLSQNDEGNISQTKVNKVKEEENNLPHRQAGNAFTNVFPNPFIEKLTIQYEVKTAGRVNISLTNSIGQEMATLFEGTSDVGNHQLNVNTKELQKGIYFIVVKTTDGIKTTSVIKN